MGNVNLQRKLDALGYDLSRAAIVSLEDAADFMFSALRGQRQMLKREMLVFAGGSQAEVIGYHSDGPVIVGSSFLAVSYVPWEVTVQTFHKPLRRVSLECAVKDEVSLAVEDGMFALRFRAGFSKPLYAGIGLRKRHEAEVYYVPVNPAFAERFWEHVVSELAIPLIRRSLDSNRTRISGYMSDFFLTLDQLPGPDGVSYVVRADFYRQRSAAEFRALTRGFADCLGLVDAEWSDEGMKGWKTLEMVFGRHQRETAMAYLHRLVSAVKITSV
ncbi:hypothetical protein HYY74_02425 [Candidatus Woesearchaeota archaeon]|nr:hypothetical protein [Candidatus Woesearchaeota archaeon]